MLEKFLIRLVKFISKGLLAFLLLMLMYFGAALIGSVIPVNSKPDYIGDITIYLRTNGVHTDFIFPIENEIMDWKTLVDPDHSLSHIENTRYVSFGWGDLEFYQNTPQWSDLTFPVAFKAVFLATPSAMHVEFQQAVRMDQPTISLKINEQQYRDLAQYVANSFEKNGSGRANPIPDLHYKRNDAFYPATRSLHFFYTCNTWVNEGLKAADLRACLWTPFDEGIFYQYR